MSNLQLLERAIHAALDLVGKNNELEIRFGKPDRNSAGKKFFNTDVGERHSRAVENYLKAQYWSQVEQQEFVQWRKGARRYRFAADGKLVESIIKKRLSNNDYIIEKYPMSVRISISNEIKLDEMQKSFDQGWSKTTSRRITFKRELFVVDLTSTIDHGKVQHQQEIEIRKVSLPEAADIELSQELTNLVVNILQIMEPFELEKAVVKEAHKEFI